MAQSQRNYDTEYKEKGSMDQKGLRMICIFFTFMAILFAAGCAEPENGNTVAGRIYTYTGESSSKIENDTFTITIHEDGTYSYYESLFSSYIGYGRWSVKNGILTLLDDTGVPISNHFLIDGKDLVFVEKYSTNFSYTKVKDGERFHGVIMDKQNT